MQTDLDSKVWKKIVNTNLTYWEFGFCISDGDRARILVKLFIGVRKAKTTFKKDVIDPG